MDRLTLTDIAERICTADRVYLSENSIVHTRLRYAERLGFFERGEARDGRGTWAFPVAELYRARILTAVADMTLSVSDIGPLIARAANEARPASVPGAWPERTRVDGGFQWRGFADIVAGVQAGEHWTLELTLWSPSRDNTRRLSARFYEGDGDSALADAIFATRPLGRLTFDLADLFAGLDS